MAYIRNKEGRLEMHPLPPVTKGKICIIGESPNITELRKGEFFISTGADVLKQTLTKCGVRLEDCYFTVAVPFLMSKKNKKLSNERWEQERARLIQSIKESECSLVMPLGVLATGLLLNDKKVSVKKVLGNMLDIPELPGVKIIPNFHPAMLIHSPGNYKVFHNVINSVAQLYKGARLDPGTTRWFWVDTREKLLDLIETINKLPWVAADIETSSLNTKEAQLWVLGVWVEKNKIAVIPRELILAEPELINKLFDTKCSWVWHHGKYDTEVLHWRGFNKARLDHDTIYMHYCLNETNGTHGLGTCATIYLGAGEYKSKMNSEFAAITTEEDYLRKKEDLAERVAMDTDYTGQLFQIFSPRIFENENHSKLYHKLLMPGANLLRKVQMRGMKIDVPYLLQREPIYEQRIQEMTEAIQKSVEGLWDPERYKKETGAKSVSDKFKPTSVPQLKWLIYDRLNLQPKHKGAKKKGTGAEVLETIPNAPAFIHLLLDLRKIKKEYSTYVRNYLQCKDENDIVHPTFNLHITATGRLSCVEPNVQNVPSSKPDVRRAFIPRGKDRILMEVDYSGAELRVLAYVSGDQNLTRALVEGDPHGELAESIFGDAYRNADPKTKKLLRGRAKTVNFGVAYGREAPSIAEAFNISLEEAQSYISAWANMYPKAWAYLQSCEEDVRAGRPLTTLYGRYRRFGLIHIANFHDLVNEAKNFRIQSISSDNTLLSAIKADSYLEKNYKADIINLIHDSILIDCPSDPETVQAVARYMSNTMVQLPKEEYGCTVPSKSDVDVGPNWGTLAAYNIDKQTVVYNAVEYSYEEWITSQGVII